MKTFMVGLLYGLVTFQVHVMCADLLVSAYFDEATCIGEPILTPSLGSTKVMLGQILDVCYFQPQQDISNNVFLSSRVSYDPLTDAILGVFYENINCTGEEKVFINDTLGDQACQDLGGGLYQKLTVTQVPADQMQGWGTWDYAAFAPSDPTMCFPEIQEADVIPGARNIASFLHMLAGSCFQLNTVSPISFFVDSGPVVTSFDTPDCTGPSTVLPDGCVLLEDLNITLFFGDLFVTTTGNPTTQPTSAAASFAVVKMAIVGSALMLLFN